MLENFKMVARELRRQLKISVFLPDDYNETETEYPLIYSLDGQYLCSDETADKQITIDSSMYNEAIIVGIQAPTNPDWRISEIGAYYDPINNKNADFSLVENFGNFFANILNPLICEKYRINKNKIGIIGYNDGAMFPFYEAVNYPDFKYAALLSPTLDKCYPHLFDLIKANHRNDIFIYLYIGGKNNENVDLSYNLFTLLDKLGNSNIQLSYEENGTNSGNDWSKEIPKFIEFIKKA